MDEQRPRYVPPLVQDLGSLEEITGSGSGFAVSDELLKT